MRYTCTNGHENIAYSLPGRCPNCGSTQLQPVMAGGAAGPSAPPVAPVASAVVAAQPPIAPIAPAPVAPPIVPIAPPPPPPIAVAAAETLAFPVDTRPARAKAKVPVLGIILSLSGLALMAALVVLFVRRDGPHRLAEMVHQSSGAASVMLIVGVLLGILLVLVLPTVLYLLTLQKALRRCAPENRAMAPWLVWLMIIPVFHLVWHFFVVINVAKSLEAEFRQRGRPDNVRPGQSVGLAMCILGCCSLIPIAGIPCGLAAFVCWIVYWVKIAGLSASVASAQKPQSQY